MKKQILKLTAMLLLPAALLAFIGCSSTSKNNPNVAMDQDLIQTRVLIDTETGTAVVESINASERTVVLRHPDGSRTTYECGPDVINFGQIKVGDQVTATVGEELAIVLTKRSVHPGASQTSAIVRAPFGAKPAGKIVNTTTFTAKVVSVDQVQRQVTLQTMDGRNKTVKVGPDINLANVQPGDNVGVQLTRAFMIAVTTPEPAPTPAVPVAVAVAPAAAAVVPAAPALVPDEAAAIGTEAYIYGYPLVTMEYTRRVLTNVEKPEGKAAPMGQFLRLRAYPTPEDKQVTAPNADTLYTIAWLDVGKEPWILSLPDATDRYYLFPMLDGWTDVFQDPGKRTTGTGPQKYAITGPGWSGTLPDGVTEYKSPTSMVWILGRIYCTGTPEDYDAVHKMQDEISVVPLSSYGQPYTPSPGTVDPAIDMKTPVRNQVNALSAEDYFKLLARAY